MANYKVTSEILTGSELGATITEEQILELGATVEHLLESGHITKTTTNKKED